MRKLLQFCILVALLPWHAYAETFPLNRGERVEASELSNGIVRLEGLTFSCPSCVERSDGFCEFVVAQEAVLLPCGELTGVLLRQQRLNNELGGPDEHELVSYLLSERRDYPLVRDALLLLFARENLQTDAATLLELSRRYSLELAEVVGEVRPDSKAVRQFWLSAPEVFRGNPQLAAAFLSAHSENTVEEYLVRIASPNFTDVTASLLSTAELLRLRASSRADELVMLAEALSVCALEGVSPACVDSLEGEQLQASAKTVVGGFSGEDTSVQAQTLADALLAPGTAPQYVARLPRSHSTYSPNDLFLYAAMLLSLLAVAAMLLRTRRIGYSGLPSQDLCLSIDERQELRELRRYFGLNPRSTEAELVRKYRRRARELHPDAGGGDPAEFAVMNQRYKRARMLLSRFSEAR